MLRLFAAVSFLYLLSVTVAFAQCVDVTTNPDAPQISCSGRNAESITDVRDNLDISVEESAVVTLDERGDLIVVSGERVTITNHGFVGEQDPSDFDIDDAFRSTGDFFRFTNARNAEITGVNNAILSSGNVDEEIVNAGTIRTSGTSLSIRGDNHTIINEATGVISSESDAIDFRTRGDVQLSGVVINGGLIESQEEAISGDFLDLENTGKIVSKDDDAVSIISGKVRNTGEISARSDAIRLVEGELRNSGLIRSLDDMGVNVFRDVSIFNEGDVFAEEYAVFVGNGNTNTSQQSIQHTAGTLSGATAAVTLGGGEDTFAIGMAAEVMGDVLLGADADRLIVLTALGDVENSVFNGEGGQDTVVFENGIEFDDVVTTLIADGVFLLGFDNGLEIGSFKITNFEFIRFRDQSMRFDEFLAATSVVPLPAGFLLFLTGVGGLSLSRRRSFK